MRARYILNDGGAPDNGVGPCAFRATSSLISPLPFRSAFTMVRSLATTTRPQPNPGRESKRRYPAKGVVPDVGNGAVSEGHCKYDYPEITDRRGVPPKIPALMKEPNRVNMKSYILNPKDVHGQVIDTLGGMSTSVVTGRKTEIKEFRVAKGKVTGRVVTSDGRDVTEGVVLLTLITGEGAKARYTNQKASFGKGRFVGLIETACDSVRAYLVPPPGYGDATSPTLRVTK